MTKERQMAADLLQRIPDDRMYYVVGLLEEAASPAVTDDPFYSQSNLEHLSKIISEAKSGNLKFTEHDLIEV